MFPKSANVYNSFGEAYMKNKNNKLAIVNYKRVLELNTANDNAKEMIKQCRKIG